MAELSLFESASQDYRDAFGWYHEREPHLAQAFEQEVAAAFEQIQHSPQRFGKYDERHRFFLLKRFPYLVVYRVYSDLVLVVAIAHERRKPGFWKNRNQ